MDKFTLPSSKNNYKTAWPWVSKIAQKPYKNIIELPKISITTPSFNQGEFIEETFRSVLLQNYPDLEYIIVDGGSKDNTSEIINFYSNYFAFHVIENDNGQSQAINKGLEKSNGTIFGWLNSDDILEQNSLFEIADYFTKNPDCDVLVGACGYLDKDSIPFDHKKAPKNIDLKEILYRFKALPQPSVYWRGVLNKKLGYLKENLHYAMDTELFLRFFLGGARFHFLPEKVIAYERLHVGQKSRNKFEAQKEKALISKKIFKESASMKKFSLAKMILYNRYHILKRHGMRAIINGFPNGQEYAILKAYFFK
tara:strand:- start:1827 stop:2756 length:930 start_codon:yes stop_codon:yes gene_type:complete